MILKEKSYGGVLVPVMDVQFLLHLSDAGHGLTPFLQRSARHDIPGKDPPQEEGKKGTPLRQQETICSLMLHGA